MFFNLCIAIFCSIILSCNAQAVPCPFNQVECQCVETSPNVFFNVFCQTKDANRLIPKFESSPTIKYKIENFWISYFDARTIPAGHFKAFESINSLTLLHNTNIDQNPTQKWDDTAFAGPEIENIEIVSMNGLVPVPKSMQNAKGLVTYRFWSPSPVELKANSFAGMKSLKKLELMGTKVTQIDSNALAGLENQLEEFAIADTLTDENLIDVIRLVKKLGKLNTLYLTGAPALSKVDLFNFTDVGGDGNFHLGLNFDHIELLTASGISGFAKNFKLEAILSQLTAMDSSIKNLLDNMQAITIDLRLSKFGACDTFKWMTQVDCPARVNINGVTCTQNDGKPINLGQFLSSVDPANKCTSNN